MRYALTYRLDETWASVDTIIIETDELKDEGGNRWYDNEDKVAGVLSAYGLDSEQLAEVMNNRWWFIRNIDDIDFYVNREGELV